MKELLERIKNEPALVGALITSLLLTLGAWQVMEVTPDQLTRTENFVTLLTTFIAPLLITGFGVRSRVVPVRKLEQAGIDIELVDGVNGLPE